MYAHVRHALDNAVVAPRMLGALLADTSHSGAHGAILYSSRGLTTLLSSQATDVKQHHAKSRIAALVHKLALKKRTTSQVLLVDQNRFAV
jgi:hypothetical protein